MGLRLDVKVRDSDLLARLEETTTVIVPRELEHMVEKILDESITVAQDYPPETQGNQPPPPYYQRGAGMIGWGGGIVRGKESENLGAQWIMELTATEDRVEGSLVNRASYSGYVHGDPQDSPPQTIFHKAHGWQTIANIVRGQIGEADAGVAGAAKGAVEETARRIVNFFNR